MRAAFQQCDFEFSWNIYKFVCQCVKNQDMQNIDRDFPCIFMPPELLVDRVDQDRDGLWALVLVDLSFRLLHGKPAIITADLTEWRVNLPGLDTVSGYSEHPNQVAATLVFFVRSRLTLLLLGLFENINQEAKDKSTVIKSMEILCAEIEAVIAEFSVVSLPCHPLPRSCATLASNQYCAEHSF